MSKTLVLQAEGPEAFYAANGQCIKNLHELGSAFETMDDGTFGHHLNSQRNDFASWAKGILKDEILAKELLGAKDRKSAQIAVLKRTIALLKEIS